MNGHVLQTEGYNKVLMNTLRIQILKQTIFSGLLLTKIWRVLILVFPKKSTIFF